MKTKPFADLYRQLKEAPTKETNMSPNMLNEAWNDLRDNAVEDPNQPSLEIMAALLLCDERFQRLLPQQRYLQLETIVREAFNEYTQKISLFNQVGQKLADAIKESQNQ